MTTPAPRFSTRQEYRDLNRRMAEDILATGPAPYLDGGYGRRLVVARGRLRLQLPAVPIAVVSLHGGRFLVSPTTERNWVRNLLVEPRCTITSRDSREPARATRVVHAERVADVVSTYLVSMNAPWAVAQFPFPPGAGRSQIREAADGVAVFELEPA